MYLDPFKFQLRFNIDAEAVNGQDFGVRESMRQHSQGSQFTLSAELTASFQNPELDVIVSGIAFNRWGFSA